MNDSGNPTDEGAENFTTPPFSNVAAAILILGIIMSITQGLVHVAGVATDELRRSGNFSGRLESRWGKTYEDYLFVLAILDERDAGRQRVAYVTSAGIEDFNALLMRSLLIQDHSITRIEPADNDSLNYVFETYDVVINGAGVEVTKQWELAANSMDACKKTKAGTVFIYECD